MHEDYIRGDCVVEAFEIIMWQITPGDATAQLKRRRFHKREKIGCSESETLFIFIRLHQIVAHSKIKNKKTEKGGGLNSGLMKKSPGVKLPAHLSKQTFHLCATCFRRDPVKVVQ